MQKIQQINLDIVNKLIFLVKLWCFMTPGGPLGAAYTPLVVRFRPGHLNMTRGNPKSWYRQPADHSEVVRKRYNKVPSENGWSWGFFEKSDYNGPYVPPVSRYGPDML